MLADTAACVWYQSLDLMRLATDSGLRTLIGYIGTMPWVLEKWR